MATDLSGQVAVVTGAGRGIGRAIALMLANNGATVVAAARTATEIGQTVKSIRRAGGAALAVRTDICVEKDVKALFAAVCRRFRRLDILVNNAGLGIYGPLAEFDARDFDKVLAVSARGTFLCCREALKPMVKARRGYIINISSVLGFRGYANQSAYTAAKHAVMGLTKSLAVEAQPHGIRVSAVLPGGVDTAMARKSRPDLDPASLLCPEDISQAVEYLLSLSDRAAVDEIYIRRRTSSPF